MTGRVTAMALRHRDMASGSTPLSPTLKTNFVYLQHEEGIWKMADGYCQVFNDCLLCLIILKNLGLFTWLCLLL